MAEAATDQDTWHFLSLRQNGIGDNQEKLF